MTAASNVHHFPINLERGYTKLYRSRWDDKVKFRHRWEVGFWDYLIDHAQSGPFIHVTKWGPIRLDRGELLVSERELADEWEVHRNSMRAVLHRLATNGSIELRRDHINRNAGTVIRIVNYEIYQGFEESREPEKANGNKSLRTTTGTTSGPPRDQEQVSRLYNYVDETRRAGERGGPGGERREASPSPPHDPNDRRGYGTEAALPGQMILPAIEVADQELEPVAEREIAAVPVEASAPDLGSPSLTVEVPVDPVPVTAPPPEVGSPPAISNVVAIGVSPVRSPAKRATRWTLPEVPPEWIERGHAKREALGLPPADLEKQARRFVAYYTSADCRKPARKDWPASWMKFALDEDLPAYRMNGSSHEQRHDHHRSEPAYNDGACAYLARLLNGGG